MPICNRFNTNEVLVEKIKAGRLKDDSLNEEVLDGIVKPKRKLNIGKIILPDVKLEYSDWKKHIAKELLDFTLQNDKGVYNNNLRVA